MYLAGNWYGLSLAPEVPGVGIVDSLDVSVLQDRLLDEPAEANVGPAEHRGEGQAHDDDDDREVRGLRPRGPVPLS